MMNLMKITLTVPDMDCPTCANFLESLEDRVPGIQRVEASYKKQLMKVDFDEAQLSLEDLLAAVTRLGYHPAVKTA